MALKSCHDRNITHRDIKPGEDLDPSFCVLYIISNFFSCRINGGLKEEGKVGEEKRGKGREE